MQAPSSSAHQWWSLPSAVSRKPHSPRSLVTVGCQLRFREPQATSCHNNNTHHYHQYSPTCELLTAARIRIQICPFHLRHQLALRFGNVSCPFSELWCPLVHSEDSYAHLKNNVYLFSHYFICMILLILTRALLGRFYQDAHL